MNGDYSNLTAFLVSAGNMAQQRRNPKLAPGGVAQSRPSPSKFRAQDGVTDSDFVGQIISAAQQLTGGQQGFLTPQQPQMQPEMQPQMQPQMQAQQSPPQPGGLLAMLGGMMGGGQ